MRVLALDIATRTGWAADRPSGGAMPLLGAFTVPTDPQLFGATFRAFELRVGELISLHQPQHLAFEAPLLRAEAHGGITARRLLGLAAMAEKIAYQHDIDCSEANANTVRAFFVRNGHASKNDVCARCLALGWRLTPGEVGEDEADAGALWAYTKSQLEKTTQ